MWVCPHHYEQVTARGKGCSGCLADHQKWLEKKRKKQEARRAREEARRQFAETGVRPVRHRDED